MATVRWLWERPSDAFDPVGTAYPQSVRIEGTNFRVEGLAFDATTDEACSTRFQAASYASGNLTVNLVWCSMTAVTGTVRWGAAIAAITPDADTQDVSTDAFATENTVDDAHLGTTAKRLMKCTITITNLDSLAADDIVHLRIRRVASNGADTLADDAVLQSVELTYSDT